MREVLRKNIANIITVMRIICVIIMLHTETFSTLFFTFYIAAGVTDIIDGFLARKLKIESDFGARLDSFCDVSFLIAGMIKIFPLIYKEIWIYLWIDLALIAVLKVVTVFLIKKKTGNFGLLHTYVAKFNGVFLFLGPILMRLWGVNEVGLLLGICCTYGALEDLIIVAQSKEVDLNIRGTFDMDI